MNRLRQKLIRWTSAVSAGMAGSLFLIAPVQAGFFDFTGKALANLATIPLQIITWLFTTVAGVVFTAGSYILNWGIDLNKNIVSGPLVQTGFKITLDLANLGFVLVIIIIAGATILRLEEYGYKKLLKNLVIAAVLVNFSLGIAGIFVDFTGVASDFFLKSATNGDPKEMISYLGKIMEPQAIQKSFSDARNVNGAAKAAETSGFLDTSISIIVGSIFNLIFTVILAITMLGMGILVLVRFIALSILLILMPLAWLCWTTPNLAHYFTDWWKQFTRWCFFLPIMLFFLYLAIFVFTAPLGAGAIPDTGVALLDSIGAKAIVPALAKMVLVIGVLIAGMTTANKMGVAGGAAVIGAAGAVKGWATGAIKGTYGKLGGTAGRGLYRGTGADSLAKKTARGLSNTLNRPGLRWIPGAKTAVSGLSAFGSRKEEVEAYEKQLHTLTPDQVTKRLKESPPINNAEAAALFKHAVDNKHLDAIPKENLAKYANKIASVNPGAEIEKIPSIKAALEANPHLAGEILGHAKGSPEELGAVKKYALGLGAKAGENISKEALADKNVAFNLGKAALGSIARGSDEKREALMATLEESVTKALAKELEETQDMIEKTSKEIRDAKDAGNTPALTIAQALKTTAQAKYDTAAAQLNIDQREAWSRIQYLNQTIANQKTFIT